MYSNIISFSFIYILPLYFLIIQCEPSSFLSILLPLRSLFSFRKNLHIWKSYPKLDSVLTVFFYDSLSPVFCTYNLTYIIPDFYNKKKILTTLLCLIFVSAILYFHLIFRILLLSIFPYQHENNLFQVFLTSLSVSILFYMRFENITFPGMYYGFYSLHF